ncbi:jg527, partial [Pararge aegeria aegeria]
MADYTNISKLCAFLSIKISLALTVKENFMRNHACLRVPLNVPKGVSSPPMTQWASVEDYALKPFSFPCPVLGRIDEAKSGEVYSAQDGGEDQHSLSTQKTALSFNFTDDATLSFHTRQVAKVASIACRTQNAAKPLPQKRCREPMRC